ncbi:hypothetical protein NQ315_005377 [Exocentrus adspersus]|uniref:MADF domain-containing protein n=1 Tax=Exocentrus adspersus TaxID=1586481 RepID=A0AAV8W218_9CUCU|nr:hypothetical protein NQ315_005377 [Exocentrus adspersus]
MEDIDSTFWVRPFQNMEWSVEASLALIDEYKRHRVLWDVKDQSYSSKSLKQEAWEAIAFNMQLDAQEVKQKMNSLLGSFRREKSKIRKNRENSNGQGSYSSKWFAFERMNFLLREGDTDTLGAKFEEEEDSIFEELRYGPQEPFETGQSEKKAYNISLPLLKRQMKLVKPMSDPPIDDFSIFTPQDENSAFGQYISCKLRKFNPKTRAFVEHAINQVLFEADMGKYDNMPSPFASSAQDWETATSNPNLAGNSIPESPPVNDNSS